MHKLCWKHGVLTLIALVMVLSLTVGSVSAGNYGSVPFSNDEILVYSEDEEYFVQFTTTVISTFYFDDYSKTADGSGITIQLDGMEDPDLSGSFTVTNPEENRAKIKQLEDTYEIENGYSNLTGLLLSFDFEWSGTGSFSVNGTNHVETNGKINVNVGFGQFVTVEIFAADDEVSNKLTLKNFKLSVPKDAKATISYNSSLGSVTADGTPVNPGDKVKVPANSSVQLVAETKNNGQFVCWTDGHNNFLSIDKTYELNTNEDTTVKAVFADSTPYFLGDGKLYEGLASASQSGASKIVLMNNATLTATEKPYVIPAGMTLLIPRDTAHNLDIEKPVASPDAYVKPTAYRTLTMAAGAKLIVNGNLDVSAMHLAGTAGTNVGSPVGPVAFVDMEEGSQITVTNGGNLYAYGYIIGDGSVLIKRGATAYEYFQITDYRGGNQSKYMAIGENKSDVFLFSQYYVQNVEVPMTLEQGAFEYGYCSMYVTIIDQTTYSTVLPFIGDENSGAMFRIVGKDGYATKEYKGDSDRLELTLYGDCSLSTLAMSVANMDIDTSTFVLSLNNNFTVNISAGTATLYQDIALLPGTRFTVEKGATMMVGEDVKVYVYDAAEWGPYCGYTNPQTMIPLAYAPGRPASVDRRNQELTDATIHVAGTLDASNGYVYTTRSGAAITGENGGVVKIQAGNETVTRQAVGAGGETVAYVEIPITPAQLKNENGSYQAAGTYTYNCNAWGGEHSFGTAHGQKINDASCTKGAEYRVKCDNCPVEHETLTVFDKNTASHAYEEKTSQNYVDADYYTDGYWTLQCKYGCGTKKTEYNPDDLKWTVQIEIENDSIYVGETPNPTVTVTGPDNVDFNVVLGFKDSQGNVVEEFNTAGDYTIYIASYDQNTGCDVDASATATLTVSVKGPVASTNKYSVTYQVGLIEPWFLRINFYVKTSAGQLIDPASFKDYGAFAIRMSDLPNAAEVIATKDYEAILGSEFMTSYTKGEEVSVHEPDNHAMFATVVNKEPCLSFRFRESIYTYEMGDPIVYFCWYEDDAGLHYSPIVKRSIIDLVNSYKDKTSFAEDERAVYANMSILYDDIVAHRGTGETTLPDTELITVAESTLGTPAVNSQYKFSRYRQIVLIEPWGIRMNVRARTASGGVTLNYSDLDDYGIIVYHAKDNQIPANVTEMLSKSDAYVFSKSNQNVFVESVGGEPHFCCRYRNEIYTYQLDSAICYVGYVVVDGNYYYSNVVTDNIKELAAVRATDTTGAYTETEQAVYTAMVNLYDAITPYREARQ